ncbi:hypothetical protein SLEP1_g59940 [Rubroshorea leprosula]|uniref:Uncharacterized protein n=1 Tax=Rubroshorea leprosula TaxID=152421 RepID=A0AAV5MXY0_9ROSI|nr:hypothetical protein SLEP1_g59940 [Rubroshorea leprosula]
MCLCIGDLHSVLTFDSFNGDFCVFSFRSIGFGFSGAFRFQVVEKSLANLNSVLTLCTPRSSFKDDIP